MIQKKRAISIFLQFFLLFSVRSKLTFPMIKVKVLAKQTSRSICREITEINHKIILVSSSGPKKERGALLRGGGALNTENTVINNHSIAKSKRIMKFG